MKQLIIAAALLPLILACIMQVNHDEEFRGASFEAEQAIRYACAKAEQEGGFTEQNEQQLRQELIEAYKANQADIVTSMTRPNEAEDTATYEIKIKAGKIIAANIFGIRPEQNKRVEEFKGKVYVKKVVSEENTTDKAIKSE
jgi:major membrane immunogen (membrane-anchored lipoprotein)